MLLDLLDSVTFTLFGENNCYVCGAPLHKEPKFVDKAKAYRCCVRCSNEIHESTGSTFKYSEEDAFPSQSYWDDIVVSYKNRVNSHFSFCEEEKNTYRKCCVCDRTYVDYGFIDEVCSVCEDEIVDDCKVKKIEFEDLPNEKIDELVAHKILIHKSLQQSFSEKDRNEFAEEIIKALRNHMYVYGGYVRDKIAGDRFADLDLFMPNNGTSPNYLFNKKMDFSDMVSLLESSGFKVIPLPNLTDDYQGRNPNGVKLDKAKYCVTNNKGLSIDIDLVKSNKVGPDLDHPYPNLDADINTLALDSSNKVWAVTGLDAKQIELKIKSKLFSIANVDKTKQFRVDKLIDKGYRCMNQKIKVTDLKVGQDVKVVIKNTTVEGYVCYKDKEGKPLIHITSNNFVGWKGLNATEKQAVSLRYQQNFANAADKGGYYYLHDGEVSIKEVKEHVKTFADAKVGDIFDVAVDGKLKRVHVVAPPNSEIPFVYHEGEKFTCPGYDTYSLNTYSLNSSLGRHLADKSVLKDFMKSSDENFSFCFGAVPLSKITVPPDYVPSTEKTKSETIIIDSLGGDINPQEVTKSVGPSGPQSVASEQDTTIPKPKVTIKNSSNSLDSYYQGDLIEAKTLDGNPFKGVVVFINNKNVIRPFGAFDWTKYNFAYDSNISYIKSIGLVQEDTLRAGYISDSEIKDIKKISKLPDLVSCKEHPLFLKAGDIVKAKISAYGTFVETEILVLESDKVCPKAYMNGSAAFLKRPIEEFQGLIESSGIKKPDTPGGVFSLDIAKDTILEHIRNVFVDKTLPMAPLPKERIFKKGNIVRVGFNNRSYEAIVIDDSKQDNLVFALFSEDENLEFIDDEEDLNYLKNVGFISNDYTSLKYINKCDLDKLEFIREINGPFSYQALKELPINSVVKLGYNNTKAPNQIQQAIVVGKSFDNDGNVTYVHLGHERDIESDSSTFNQEFVEKLKHFGIKDEKRMNFFSISPNDSVFISEIISKKPASIRIESSLYEGSFCEICYIDPATSKTYLLEAMYVDGLFLVKDDLGLGFEEEDISSSFSETRTLIKQFGYENSYFINADQVNINRIISDTPKIEISSLNQGAAIQCNIPEYGFINGIVLGGEDDDFIAFNKKTTNLEYNQHYILNRNLESTAETARSKKYISDLLGWEYEDVGIIKFDPSYNIYKIIDNNKLKKGNTVVKPTQLEEGDIVELIIHDDSLEEAEDNVVKATYLYKDDGGEYIFALDEPYHSDDMTSSYAQDFSQGDVIEYLCNKYKSTMDRVDDEIFWSVSEGDFVTTINKVISGQKTFKPNNNNNKESEEVTKMSTTKDKSLVQVFTSDVKKAGVRSGTTLGINGLKAGIQKILSAEGVDGAGSKAIMDFFNGDFGEALLRAGLGYGLMHLPIPQIQENEYAQSISEELRVSGISKGMDKGVALVEKFIVPSLLESFQGTPLLENIMNGASNEETKQETKVETKAKARVVSAPRRVASPPPSDDIDVEFDEDELASARA